MLYIILAVLAAAAVAGLVILIHSLSRNDLPDTPEYELAGRIGEEDARSAIEPVLREGDRLFTNVEITFEGKTAEFDLLILNKYGVFGFEVKNYSGRLVGGEDDYEWRKFKTTDAGNTYEKTVRNPIKQIRRAVYILARYLEYYGLGVWVEGYAILLRDNSPVESKYVLNSPEEVDRAIHTASRKMLDSATVDGITELLKTE